MSRTKASIKNFIWTNLRTYLLMILRFVLRTVFIKKLGATYLGVDGLFTNILGFLSLAELGISGAISFSLYEPLAKKDIPKIQALINFYRKAYRIVAAVVLVLGVVLIPFIPKIAKGADGIAHLQLIFCIYLFNTVSSYLITYKSTIITADQKHYILSNIVLVFNLITIALQTVSLFVFSDYIIYLLISSVFNLMSSLYIFHYSGKLYPFIKHRNNQQLDKKDSRILFTKIKALLYHKIGQVAISQTDSIITSSVINVTMVGYVNNYNMIINVIKSASSSIFDMIVPSLGNLIATEDREHQLLTYKRVEFLNYWVNSFTSISLFFMLTPFVRIWLGENFELADSVVFLLVINYYIYISRLPIFSVRSAAGTFEPDRFSPIVESIVNIAVSIILARQIGIEGVYIGTLVSSFVPWIWSPIVVHKYVFNLSSKKYFFRQGIRFAIVMAYGYLMKLFFDAVNFNGLVLNLVFRGVICLLIPNLVIVLIYSRTNEFKYLINTVKNLMLKLKKHNH